MPPQKNDFNTHLGAWLKELRLDAGWSQQQVADALGFKNRCSISHLEKGERTLSLEGFIELARFYGYPPWELMHAYAGKRAVDRFLKAKKVQIPALPNRGEDL